MMHILFLLTQDLDSPAGLGRYFPLAKYLARMGHKVEIAALHANYQSLKDKTITTEGVNIHYVAQMHVRKVENQKHYFSTSQLLAISLQATIALSKAALRSQADIIHIGKPHPMNSIAGLLAGKLRKAKICLDCDDYEAATGHFNNSWQKSVVSYFEDKLPITVGHVTTHTHFLYDRLIKLGVPEERLTYLPNGVDPERFPHIDSQKIDRIRNELDLQGRKVVAFIGSLSSPSHPVDLLLEAFVQVHQRNPESVLLFVGGGDEFLPTQQKVLKSGISESTRFTGFIPPAQIAAYYHVADCVVDPVYDDLIGRSRLPLKMFESWMGETPFITADVGDRRFVSGDPPASALVQPGNAHALALGIEKILLDDQYAGNLRQRGLERVKEFYWNELAKTVENIYTNLL